MDDPKLDPNVEASWELSMFPHDHLSVRRFQERRK